MPRSRRDASSVPAGDPAPMGTSAEGEVLIERVRATLTRLAAFSEKRMFGGVGFLLHGNLLVGASKRGLLVRVGDKAQAECIAEPGAQPLQMKGRVLAGYVRVAPAALGDGDAVKRWLKRAIAFVETLPAKPVKPPKPRR